MDLTRFFRPDYQSARAAFLVAAQGCGAVLESVSHPEPGPDGQPIATDVAWIGPRDAERVMVVLSGTHGVEGFCGSGAQLHWLLGPGPAALPRGIAALLVHAVNPFGFAWQRRVDHQNIDLNRNWIDFAAGAPANPGYGKLHQSLLPATWGAKSIGDVRKAIADYASEHGEPALRFALTGGQYQAPEGIFFGGNAPAWSRATMTAIYTGFLAQARRIVVLDYHSGLGESGMVEQLSPACSDEPEFDRAARCFGAAVVSVADGASSSAKVGGDGMSSIGRLLPWAEVTTLGMEFGTQPFHDVLEALLADNWLHARGDPLGPAAVAIKRQLKAAFCGEDDVWRAMVVAQSGLALRQAAGFLAH